MTETDILKDPLAIKTYWEMMGVTEWEHAYQNPYNLNPTICEKCNIASKTRHKGPCLIPDPIPLSVGDLAFFMANQCRKYSKELVKTLNQLWKKQSGSFPFPYWLIYIATPEQRIEAACAAWSTKDEED